MSNLPYPDPNSLPYPTGNVPGIPQFPIAGEMPMPQSNFNQGYPQPQQGSQLSYRGPSAPQENFLPGQSPQNFGNNHAPPPYQPEPHHGYSSQKKSFTVRSSSSYGQTYDQNSYAQQPYDPYSSHHQTTTSDPYGHDPYMKSSSEKKKSKTVNVPMIGKVKKKNLYKAGGAAAAGLILKEMF